MPTARTTTPRTRASSIARTFNTWLGLRDQGQYVASEQEKLRLRLIDDTERYGHKDADGHSWLALTEAIEFKDSLTGKVHVYTQLKRERHLTPKTPMPDPDKSIMLLKRLKLWIKKTDVQLLTEIGMRNPYIKISIDVDPDAVASAYYKGLINEHDYDAILQEQKETWQFRPQES